MIGEYFDKKCNKDNIDGYITKNVIIQYATY